MYYCYDIKEGLFDTEKEYAKELGVYLFYDKDKDVFSDKDGNIVDITDKDCFIRTGVYNFSGLLDAVIRHNGRNITEKGQAEKVLNWPRYIDTKRRATIYSGEEILTNLDEIISSYGNDRVFFKTKDKNYSGIVDIGDFAIKGSNLYRALEIHKDEDFIISDEVDVLENDNGPFEWRCFIVNGKILNISRTNDYLLEQVPDYVIDKALAVMKKLSETDFPSSFVLDLFMYTDLDNNQVFDVLECNPIESSGTYLYNSVFIDNYDIRHTCPSASIPKEKILYGDLTNLSYNAPYNGRASIVYQLPGHFAGDLASIALTGEASDFSYLHIDSERNVDFSKLSSRPMKTLQSDDDLDGLRPKTQMSIDDVLSSLKDEDGIKRLLKKFDE